MKEKLYEILENYKTSGTAKKKLWDYIVKHNAGLKEITERYRIATNMGVEFNDVQLITLLVKDISQSSYIIKDRLRMREIFKFTKTHLSKAKVPDKIIDKVGELLEFTVLDEELLSDIDGKKHLMAKANNEQRVILEMELLPFAYLNDKYDNFNITRYKHSQKIMNGSDYLTYLRKNLRLLNNSLNAPLFRTSPMLLYNNKAKSNLSKTIKWVNSGHRLY